MCPFFNLEVNFTMFSCIFSLYMDGEFEGLKIYPVSQQFQLTWLVVRYCGDYSLTESGESQFSYPEDGCYCNYNYG